MLVAAASDLLPNVRGEFLCLGYTDNRFEDCQTDIPPLFHADRNRHFHHLCMSIEIDIADKSGQSC